MDLARRLAPEFGIPDILGDGRNILTSAIPGFTTQNYSQKFSMKNIENIDY
jgi:hypothetical protein